MFQLLKKLLIFLFLCLCCVPQVNCHHVDHVNKTAGQNLTVEFTLDSTSIPFQGHRQVMLYQGISKMYTFNLANKTCFSNSTVPTICITNVTQETIRMVFTHLSLTQSGVYHIAVLIKGTEIKESNRVNLTVLPAEYTTTYTTATSRNVLPPQKDQSGSESSLLMAVPVLVVGLVLVAVYVCFYWNYRKKTDKPPAANPTSAPQVISAPSVTCVEYCVLDFPNRPGDTVRSTEERVEYSPIVFPPRKTLAKDDGVKSTTQQKKSPKPQHEKKDSDQVSEQARTANPRHQNCPKKSHLKPPSHVPKAQV